MFCCFLTGFATHKTMAQVKDTLPAFAVVSKQGVVTISWVNGFKQSLSQINIQRSKDSLKGFITIYSLPDPDQRVVSYVDKTAKNDSSYYRIFILFNGANYSFTVSKRPFRDTAKVVQPTPRLVKDTTALVNNQQPAPQNATTPVKEAEKAPAPVKKVWVPSTLIYTGNDGHVVIALPDAAQKHYNIRFMREDSTFLFRIPHVKESFLKLDKVNFMKAGWVLFELYDGDVLVEKNKLLITPDY